MKRRMGGVGLFSTVLVSAAVLLAGCEAREPDKSIRKKFDVVVAADFKAIVSDLPGESLADSMYFRIVEYSAYGKSLYSVRAVVDYYYLKGVHVKRTVKYRYVKNARKWERYANEYRSYLDTAQAR
jgi:hypothetical protein